METIDLANGFRINSNSSKPDVSQKQETAPMKIQTKKADAGLVQKEIVKKYEWSRRRCQEAQRTRLNAIKIWIQ